ncbi:hypothetical protein ABPG72_018358 [Tetrahymena utriculariae]
MYTQSFISMCSTSIQISAKQESLGQVLLFNSPKLKDEYSANFNVEKKELSESQTILAKILDKKISQKHQNIQKLDLNFLPNQSKKKTIHQILEYKIMYSTFIQSFEHVSKKSYEQRQNFANSLYQLQNLTSQKKQQGSQSNIILRTLESQFDQTNYPQFQSYGSKNQIGQQLSQHSLSDNKKMIQPDIHNRNQSQKSNLDLKINPQSKSSTQLKEKQIQEKGFTQQSKKIRSIKSVDLNDLSESSATNRILSDTLANQNKTLLEILSTLALQNKTLLKIQSTMEIQNEILLDIKSTMANIQTKINMISDSLVKMNFKLQKIDENNNENHSKSFDKLNDILKIMHLKEQDYKIKQQIQLALHGNYNFRYEK